MKQPVAGVVGDEGDLGGLTRQAQDRVAQRAEGAVPGDLPKMHAVQMHGMGERGVVDERNAHRFPAREIGEGRVGATDHAAQGPELAALRQRAGVEILAGLSVGDVLVMP